MACAVVHATKTSATGTWNMILRRAACAAARAVGSASGGQAAGSRLGLAGASNSGWTELGHANQRRAAARYASAAASIQRTRANAHHIK